MVLPTLEQKKSIKIMSSEESVNFIYPYCAVRKTCVVLNECKQHFKRFLQISPAKKNAGELLKAMKKQSV